MKLFKTLRLGPVTRLFRLKKIPAPNPHINANDNDGTHTHVHHVCLHTTHAHPTRTHASHARIALTPRTRTKHACLTEHTTYARIPCTPRTQAALGMHTIAHVVCVHACMGCVGVRAWHACVASMRKCDECASDQHACLVGVACVCISFLSLASTPLQVSISYARHTSFK